LGFHSADTLLPAAAYEKRFALCAVLGANHNWGEMQRRRQEREGETPVPHYWDHVMWVFGKPISTVS